MKIKLDENLPQQLAILLRELHHDVHTVNDELLTGHPDANIWGKCQQESRFLITQDLDFSDVRQFAPGSHEGILLVRLHSPDRQSLVKRVLEIFEDENVDEWRKCFVVATERKLRVLKPG